MWCVVSGVPYHIGQVRWTVGCGLCGVAVYRVCLLEYGVVRGMPCEWEHTTVLCVCMCVYPQETCSHEARRGRGGEQISYRSHRNMPVRQGLPAGPPSSQIPWQESCQSKPVPSSPNTAQP